LIAPEACGDVSSYLLKQMVSPEVGVGDFVNLAKKLQVAHSAIDPLKLYRAIELDASLPTESSQLHNIGFIKNSSLRTVRRYESNRLVAEKEGNPQPRADSGQGPALNREAIRDNRRSLALEHALDEGILVNWTEQLRVGGL
jgi:hypothetical protein